MRAPHLAFLSSVLFLCAVPALAAVLTPYRLTNVEVETEYPTYPYPSYPDLPVYRKASDADTSLTGGYITRTAQRPGDSLTSYGLAEAAADFGEVRAGSDVVTSADGRTKGKALAEASFGDGFIVEGGPENGTARITFLLEGLLDHRYPSYDTSAQPGAWAQLDVTLWENFEGGGVLIHAVIHPNKVVSDSAVPGASVVATSGSRDEDYISNTATIAFPYQASKDYFMEMRLETSAARFGFSHFMNTASVSAFVVEAGSVLSFASGTPASDYNVVPEPHMAGLFLAGASLLAGRRRRQDGCSPLETVSCCARRDGRD